MDYDDGDDVDAVVVKAGPIYNAAAWNTHEDSGNQCSQARDFCYLCTHRPHPTGEPCVDDDGEPIIDYHTMLCDVARTLASEEAEVATIVTTMYNLYEEEVRKEVVYYHPITKMTMEKPEWTKASIQRHILYSGLCPELHESMVDHIFHNIIDSHNAFMKNLDNGRLIENERKAFMDTMKHYTNWRKHRHACKSSRRKPSK